MDALFSMRRAKGRLSNHMRTYMWLLLPSALLLVPFFIWPSLIILEHSMSGGDGWFGQYILIMSDPAIRSVLYYTFYIAALVTLITLIICYPIAFVVTHLPKALFTICIALIFLPFWVSTVIRAFAWMILLGHRGPLNELLEAIGVIHSPLRLINDGVGMLIAMVYIQIPFMVIPLINTMRTIDPSFMRAAAVLGANPFWQIVRVYLPLSAPGAAVGIILVFISSLGFFVVPSLIGGAKPMLSIFIEQQASRLLNWPLASALAAFALVLTAVLFILYKSLMAIATGRNRRLESAPG
jgi:ABC-type spermidine/putrescine transport system permease subunit I